MDTKAFEERTSQNYKSKPKLPSNHMYRVLYVANSPSFVGGAERSLYTMLKNIDRANVTPYFASIYESDLASVINALDIPTLTLNPFRKNWPIPFLKSCMKMINYLKKNKIDFIHNNRAADAFYTLIPGKVTRTPVIIHNRDSYLSKMERNLLKFADYNICISNWQNKEYFNERAVLIHNGLDLEAFKSSYITNVPCAKQLLGYRSDEILVGMVSRITAIKGHDILIQAAKQLTILFPNLRFIIAGQASSEADKSYERDLNIDISNSSLSNIVKFVGYVSNVLDIIPALDIVVMPSRRESFGRTAIEAMYLGKPVIASGVGGFIDIITPECGFLIPPNDPESLATSISHLIREPSRGTEMGLAGRRRVEQYFSISHSLDRLYEFYGTIP